MSSRPTECLVPPLETNQRPSGRDVVTLGGQVRGDEFRGVRRCPTAEKQPMKFRLAINLKARQMLGDGIPPALLLLADEVIK